MLPSRLEADPRSSARLSHAVRIRTSVDDPLTVDSTNLDTLVASKLPPIEKQIDNLLKWLADRAGDDSMATIHIDLDTNLSAVVGVADPNDVDTLFEHIEYDGLVRSHGPNVQVTRKGWKRINSPVSAPKSVTPARPKVPSPATPVIEVCVCPTCGPRREADVLHVHQELYEADDDVPVYGIDKMTMLRCRGCRSIYVRQDKYFSEDEGHEVDASTGEWRSVLYPTTTYWPSAAKRKRPSWLGHVEDEVVIHLMDEIYRALDDDLRALAAMGVRALMDRAFELAGAPAAANFGAKLDHLKTKGLISERERETLTIMTDAGSAASHRGWRPEADSLGTILDAAEAVIHALMVQPEAAKRLSAKVPPRPKKGL